MAASFYAEQLLAALRPCHARPQGSYGDAAICCLDDSLIDHREWRCAGHTCEVPEAGEFLTWRVGAAEAVIVRGSDGVVRAFHNTCRHRGSRICQKDRGSAARLVCPYHQWT